MTRPSLVLDGHQIKLRLEAARQKSSGLVHIDWLRFTVQLKFAPIPTAEVLFPAPVRDALEHPRSDYELEVAQWRRTRMLKLLRDLPDSDFAAGAQAHALAQKICKVLGPEFQIEPELQKGHDFYRFRWSITRNDVECAWVGFLASGDSPRQQAQSKGIHANLYGTACTFAHGDWRVRMANLIDQCEATITRVDLALDCFEGLSGGIDRAYADWHAGAMDVRGRRPGANTVGPWVEGGRGRSFYFGSKEAGKQTNVYEKGVQLFGVHDATRWERVELRYGNKLRDLPSDVLRRPDDFFADASDWHRLVLSEQGATAGAGAIKVRAKQAVETVKAEATRCVRWLQNTAGPSMAVAFEFLGEDRFLELITGRLRPGRLRKFSDQEIKAACAALSPTVFQPRVRSIGLTH